MDTLSQLRAGKLRGAQRLDLSCGLEEFPREIFDLADTLEVLNLTGNRLTALPADFARLQKLRILFCSDNQFDHLPEVIGSCLHLSMVGFKANKIERVPEASIPASLRWLILTNNRIATLPASLGRCERLQKLMLSGNRLRELPASLAACENLELIRLAANDLHELPDWLLALPRLAWLALAGNPCTPLPSLDSSSARSVHWHDLEWIEVLGEGASGFVHRARWIAGGNEAPRDVAVKIFKGAMTSDGLPECELAASLTVGTHPNLIEMHGRVAQHPSDAPGLVMALINPEFTPLAGPPTFETCTRDVYADEQTFAPRVALRILQRLASAAEHIHRHSITHGDFYAHNVLVNAAGDCMLGDFGAASFYPARYSKALQQIEVRAFGYLMEELLSRTQFTTNDAAVVESLSVLRTRCLDHDFVVRPLFGEIGEALARTGCSSSGIGAAD